MKLKIFNKENQETGNVDLPNQFNEEIRTDIIKRAVLAIQNNNRQAYGSDIRAGMKHSTRISKRRRDYRGCYGHGISRIPRKITSRRGTRMNWIGAEVSGTRGGRRAHPPKVDKKWGQKVNKKENRKAIRSAMSATVLKELVSGRGHAIPKDYPFVLDNDFEKIIKTKDVTKALVAVGCNEELTRTENRKIRAGKGTARGRKYKSKTGILIVVKEDCELVKSAKNILGIDIVTIKQLNAELLAPGATVGRMSLFTQGAIEALNKEQIFM